MKSLVLPLDERPCNRLFPQMIASSQKNIELSVPHKELLGHKKTSANVNKIIEYLNENCLELDNMIISIDMLIYGGLIPSRIHHLSEEEAMRRLYSLKDIKQQNKTLKIYAFNCIMRAPSYDSDDEEPDYYAQYGYALFRRKYLLDLKEREGLSKQEETELSTINIPLDIIKDYEERRDFNLKMNLEVLKLLEEGVIDFLVIPQDDSSPYGYTALSQKEVIKALRAKKLESHVMVYPGADEVVLSLLTRAYNEFYHKTPKIYPFYASVLGPTIIPKYEDRPMYESLKSHIRVCGAKIVETPLNADYVLAINAPGKIMQEAFDDQKDISYSTFRDLLGFVYKIQDYLEEGCKVALCDAAYSNGGDLELIHYLDELELLPQLCSYAGWNTHCNTLGTTLSQMMLCDDFSYNLSYRLIEDVLYQSLVRKEVTDNKLKKLGFSLNDVYKHHQKVEEVIKKELICQYNQFKLSQTLPINLTNVKLPWKRMFEIELMMEVG